MAKNALKPEQEMVIRDFIDGARATGLVVPAGVIHPLITVLGYKVLPNGRCVSRNTEIKFIFGTPNPYDKYEDEYYTDGEKFRADNKPAVEASPSESPESDAVGDVLQQDV